MSTDDLIASLMHRKVVFDVSSPFVYAGTLVAEDNRYFVLEDADVHDLRDTNTSRELYVVELKRLGIHANRKRVLVLRNEVVSLAALDDVLV